MTSPVKESAPSYLEVSLLGAGRGFVGLVFEHPLDTIKTRCQTLIGELSAWKTTQQIYRRQGIRGFYSGCIPNGLRLMGKQAYRYPMMMGFPTFFREILPKDFQLSYPSTIKLSTAIAIANFETFILCPLERLKVYLMTADHSSKGILEFLRSHGGHIRKELSRGLSAVYMRQMTAWVSFLVADDYFKNREREKFQSRELSFSSLLKVSFYVGATTTAVNLPFDLVKTQMQQAVHAPEKHLFEVMKRVVRTSGVRGLYAGGPVRMIQYMVQSVFTVTLLENIERRAKS